MVVSPLYYSYVMLYNGNRRRGYAFLPGLEMKDTLFFVRNDARYNCPR